MRYIPEGMVEKQYRWEWVNYQLYYRLFHLNTIPEAQSLLSRLLQMQESQLAALRNIRVLQHMDEPDVEFPATERETAEELFGREEQLLQEYLSYQVYFLRTMTHGNIPLQQLIETQMEQVNTLQALLRIYDANAVYAMMELAEGYDAWIEKGYRLEKVIGELTYPTCIAFDEEGAYYVLEAGYAYEEPLKGRVIKVHPDQSVSVVADDLEGPATGLAWYNGHLYVAESNLRGEGNDGGRILRLSPDGKKTVLISGLATYGDHFTGDVLFGRDERMYFSVGTATNSGVVGPDNDTWLPYHPNFCEIPARDYELDLQNFISESKGVKVTGAYQPYGQSLIMDGTVAYRNLYATGVIYSANPDGTDLRIVADGFRNTYGMCFSPFDGKLYVTDNGADSRGSRPIEKDWDRLWEVKSGWYGYPDFFSGLPCILPHFAKYDKPKPLFLLNKHPKLAAQPLVRFSFGSSSNKFDFSVKESFGHTGELFVAQTGEISYESGEAANGFRVVRVNLQTGQIRNFVWNDKAENNVNGPIRPVQAKFDSSGEALYIVDFGILGNKAAGTTSKKNTGSIWKVTKT